MNWLRYLLRQRVPHCRQCGDSMMRHEYQEGYRRSDGLPIVFHGWRCPRSDDDRPDFWNHGGGYIIDCMYPPPWANEAARHAYYVEHRPYKSVGDWDDPAWKL